MKSVDFNHGPYDGATFTFVDRLPDRLLLEIDCDDADLQDPTVLALMRENGLTASELDEIVSVRNSRSIRSIYELQQDNESRLFYRHAGWTVQGIDSGEAR